MRSFPARPPPAHLPLFFPFNLSFPRQRLSPRPIHCVRLLVIIIAAVSHLCGSALFGLTVPSWTLPSKSEPRKIPSVFSVYHISHPRYSPFSPLAKFSHASVFLSLTNPVSAARCVWVWGCRGFFRKTGPLLYLRSPWPIEWLPCQSVKSNLYCFIL